MKKGIYYAIAIGGLTVELLSAGYLGKEIIDSGFNNYKPKVENTDNKKNCNMLMAGMILTGGMVSSILATNKLERLTNKK
jgi:hypothetical protein